MHIGEKWTHLGGIFRSDSMGARTLHPLLVTYWVVSSLSCFLPIFWRGEVNAVEPSSDLGFGEQLYVATVCIFIESRNFVLNIQPHLL